MIFYKRSIMCCFALATWFWCNGGASAHDPQATSQPDTTGSPAPGELSADIPWHTFFWMERRYKIEALRFKARDETGIDWWGSDEVMIGTDDAKGWTVSDEIGNIDSGDVHHFDPAKSCIVAVRPGIVVLGKTSVCNDVGEPAPLGFGVEFWEKDAIGFPGGFSACVGLGEPGPGSHAGPHCASDHNDDFIGRARVDFSQQDFDAVLLNVGDEFIETVVLNHCSGESVCDVTYGPDYSFTYRITRLRDVRVVLRSALDDAMRLIDAPTELEAIAAGLRSLRAPSPRQVEPDTAGP